MILPNAEQLDGKKVPVLNSAGSHCWRALVISGQVKANRLVAVRLKFQKLCK